MILIEASLRIAAVAALVGLILMTMRVRASGARHAAWTLVLGAMVLMPVMPSIVPSLTVPLPARAGAVLLPPLVRLDSPADSLARIASGEEPAERPSATASASSHGEAPLAQPRWPIASFVTAVYMVVAVGFLARLVAGWHAAARLSRRARPIDVNRLGSAHSTLRRVRESAWVAAPLTAGVFAPSILLPRGWTEWPPEKLRACLAHELAHIRRRDSLIAFVAQVNRCIFWFHPIAWWLQRTLAVAAEEAADEAAVREIGNRRRYADVLLDIADAVRLRGARVTWQGVGADGAGRLGLRVDRVLNGEAVQDLSRLRSGVLFVTCTAVIFAVVACRQPVAAPPPLKPDPEMAGRLEKQKADEAFYERAGNMTAAEVDALEASLKRAPGDLEALKALRHFYRVSGQKVFGWDQMIARRRPHILWVVENRPEHEVAIWPVSAQADPITYAEAKKRWLAQTAKPDASEKVLTNAAHFFERNEPPVAEQMLLRAKASAVADDRRRALSRRVGEFYAHVIQGPTSPRDGSPLTGLDSDPYARDVRHRVLKSADAELLAVVGRRLSFTYRDEGRRQLGKQLLERALQLDPRQPDAQRALAAANARDRDRTVREALWIRSAELTDPQLAQKVRAGQLLTSDEGTRVAELEERALAQLPETDRFALLPTLADRDFSMAEYWNHVSDKQKAATVWARSKRYAQDALALAPTFRDHPDLGYAVYTANVVLAVNVLREGDRPQAVLHMLAAVDAPASQKLAADTAIISEQRIVNYLLKDGERDSVARFLERAAQLRTAGRERLLKDAAAIRAGQMPMSYQHMVSR